MDRWKRLILGFVVCATGVGVAADAPQAWINAVDTNAMERVLFDYTNNVIRSEWAGKDKSIGRELPANLGFQFAVVGDEDVTNRVNAILQATRDAIQPQVREDVEKYNNLCSVLQWLVRSTRQGVTNSTSYLEVNAREAVFEEADFNITLLTNKASRLRLGDIPIVAAIRPIFKVEPDHASILPAEPGVDYPDILPEQTFTTPYGIGIVLRAPEAERYFRFEVFNWRRGAEYEWRSSFVSVSINAFRFNPRMSTSEGFAEIKIAAHLQFRRIDIMVCQKHGETMGPPSYISFYAIPHIKRNYDRRNKVISIEYSHNHRNAPPYDISPIWIPRRWTDEYEYRSSDIHGFTREFPMEILPRRRAEVFSNRGELVLGKDCHDDPTLVQKVLYYVEDGELKYKTWDVEERVKGFKPRRRGEGKDVWQK